VPVASVEGDEVLAVESLLPDDGVACMGLVGDSVDVAVVVTRGVAIKGVALASFENRGGCTTP
jgi:hypothetical protein